MKPVHSSVLLAAALACTANLGAQTPPPDAPRGPQRKASAGELSDRGRPGPHVRSPGHALVRALDANHDRELSADEIAAAPAALARLDRDGDGTITRDELRPARPPHLHARERTRTPPPDAPARPPAGSRPIDPLLLALDANGNGALETDEVARAASSLGALDANADGKLTLDELRPLPPTP